MTLLIGCGNPDALLGGLAMLIAHATFKAPLFFVVGIIDTSTGTRDLTKLSGLRKSMPVVAAMAVLAAISMAGIPPMIGFAAKEAGYAGLLDGGTAGTIGTAVMAVGSAFTVAYSARFLWGAFSDKPGVAGDGAETAARRWMTGPTMLLVVLGLVLGIVPGAAGTAAAVLRADRRPDARGRDGAVARARARRWRCPRPAGWSAPRIFAAQRARERRTEIALPGGEAGSGYRATAKGVDALAVGVTAATQRGSLPVSLGAILLVLIAFPGHRC